MAPDSLPPQTPVPDSAQSFLAFDFGTRRIGVASGNRLTRTASPLPTVASEGDARWQALAALLREWAPDAVVVGLPTHPDGAAHEMTARALKFARQLHGRFGVMVFMVDERYTSAAAQSAGARDLDAGAAVLILEQFLRSLT